MNFRNNEDKLHEPVGKEEKVVQAKAILKKRNEDDPYEKFEEEYLPQTIFGIRFPWEAYFFVIIGALSEVVDALFMNETLDKLTGLDSTISIVISAIVGAGCFFSMAFAGFQLANRRYYSKIGIGFSYGFWAVAGIALVTAKLLAGMSDGGLDEVLKGNMTPGEMFGSSEFLGQAIVAIVQLVLYVGTGFMTRDSVRILTDNDIREYQLAKREYDDLLDELAERRHDIAEDVSKLKSYPKIAKRLIRSKKSVKNNVQQYNEAARAIIEAKMSISVQPELMEEMYDSAMAKEAKNKGQ